MKSEELCSRVHVNNVSIASYVCVRPSLATPVGMMQAPASSRYAP